jgi:VWFA-related protein
MKRATLALVLLATTALAQTPPEPTAPAQTSTLTVRSNLVLVPTLVKTKAGALVYTLQAKDFLITDDGVPQTLHLEEDTGGEPLALVVVVETGGDGAQHLDNYVNLGPTLDAVVGNVPHKIAVVDFDSLPDLAQPFTANADKASKTIANLEPGDNGAAILDALNYAVDLLRKQPTTYRRAILLISETLDHGSHTTLNDALRAIGDTNTAIYAIGFNSSKAESSKEASKLSSTEPGPPGGCFAHDPNSNESRATQNYDCISELLPPLRLARIAMLIAVNSLKRNVPESVAHITGGEYFKFKDTKTLERDLLTISNHVPNRYILSFHPPNPHPGFHAIEVKLNNYNNLTVEARNGYWIDDETTAVTKESAPKPQP